MASPRLPLFHPKVLAASVAVGAATGAAGGALVALGSGAEAATGAAGGIVVAGLVALFAGLLGATEPPEGWHTRGVPPTLRRGVAAPLDRAQRARAEHLARHRGRRSFAARLAAAHPALAPVTSLSLLAWAVVVGGGLTAAGLILVELARAS